MEMEMPTYKDLLDLKHSLQIIQKINHRDNFCFSLIWGLEQCITRIQYQDYQLSQMVYPTMVHSSVHQMVYTKGGLVDLYLSSTGHNSHQDLLYIYKME